MDPNEKFVIKVLGGLEIRYRDKAIGVNESKNKSNKIWVLFEYILLNHTRKLSQDELIEMLWPEMEVSNPANSLKGLIFKLRKEIDSLGFLPGKQVIPSVSGSYTFNEDVPYTVDVYEFEKYLTLSQESALSDDEKLKYLLQAVECYRGNIHHDARKEPWADSIKTRSIMYRAFKQEGQLSEDYRDLQKCAFDPALYRRLLLSYDQSLCVLGKLQCSIRSVCTGQRTDAAGIRYDTRYQI